MAGKETLELLADQSRSMVKNRLDGARFTVRRETSLTTMAMEWLGGVQDELHHGSREQEPDAELRPQVQSLRSEFPPRQQIAPDGYRRKSRQQPIAEAAGYRRGLVLRALRTAALAAMFLLIFAVLVRIGLMQV